MPILKDRIIIGLVLKAIFKYNINILAIKIDVGIFLFSAIKTITKAEKKFLYGHNFFSP